MGNTVTKLHHAMCGTNSIFRVVNTRKRALGVNDILPIFHKENIGVVLGELVTRSQQKITRLFSQYCTK